MSLDNEAEELEHQVQIMKGDGMEMTEPGNNSRCCNTAPKGPQGCMKDRNAGHKTAIYIADLIRL